MKLARKLEESKMVDKFVKNLQPVYHESVKYQNFNSFKELAKIGRKVEDYVIKAQNGRPKWYTGASSSKGKAPVTSHFVEAVNLLEAQSKGPLRQNFRAFTDIGCIYTYALQRLIAQGKLKPIGLTPDTPTEKQGKGYKPDAYCAFHQGNGHDTKRCFRLKHEIHDTIENGTLPIPAARTNNVTNPFGDHANDVTVEDIVDYSHLIRPCRLKGVFVGEIFVDGSKFMPNFENEIQIGNFGVDCTPYILRSANEINGVWADDEDNVYLTKGVVVPHTQEEILKVRKDAPESNHLTHSGRPYRVEKGIHASNSKDVPEKTSSKELATFEVLGEGSTSKASLTKQLHIAKADVSIWQLMLSSFEHRQALLQTLMNMTASSNATPDDMVAYVIPNRSRLANAVTFSDEDLPPFGPQHNLALYIVVVCLNKHIPMTLIDDGSTVNVLPLKMAHILGLEKNDFVPTTQTVQAFDGAVRLVVGLVNLVVRTGLVEKKISCQMIDVGSSFNLLLGSQLKKNS
ncbi:uncharacterized protein LOC141617991 [Silene latifolia]|uniref:uncharacterized protein LOC141617991 n=1 Tax=Silene latifolia TaxID=37657 RepID=UPI003D789D7F